MNINALTENEFAEILDQTEADVRSLCEKGMPQNPDGTFDLVHCIAWRLQHDPLPELPRGQWYVCNLAEATDWLEWFLADGARPAIAAVGEGERLLFSKRTLHRAKKALGVVSKKAGLGHWTWELPTE